MYKAAGGSGDLSRDTNMKTTTMFKALLQLNVSVMKLSPDSESGAEVKGSSSSSADSKTKLGFFKQVAQISQFCKTMAHGDAKHRAIPLSIATDFIRIYGASHNTTLENFQRSCRSWSFAADAELIRLMRRSQEKARQPPSSRTNIKGLPVTPDVLATYKELNALQGLTTADYHIRAQLLDWMGSRLVALGGFLDLSVEPHTSEMVDDIRAVKELIPWCFKKKLWDEAMEATKASNSSQLGVKVDRFRAFRLAQRNGCDVKAKTTCFSQIFRQVGNKDIFRLQRDGRFCKVEFLGEYSIDAGGPFRELITDFANELQSSHLPLFQPSSNHEAKVGQNQEKWVPVPTYPITLLSYTYIPIIHTYTHIPYILY